MTIARRVLRGTTYSLSRRCLDRRNYLKPTPDLTQIYLYALAHAQHKHGIAVHNFVAMSNHSHELVTDTRGVLPDFLRDLRREVALGAKQLYGIHQNVWSAEKPAAVEVHGLKGALKQALYVLLNPVKAALVGKVADWPGAISLPGVREIEVRRPDVWFDDGRPETLTLKLTPPPSWTRSEDEWHAWLAKQVAWREERLRRARAEAKVGVLGRQRILVQKPFDRPHNADQLVPTRSPTLAAGGDGALLRASIAQLREWRRAYRAALERWRIDKTTRFPAGTWWVVRHAGAACA